MSDEKRQDRGSKNLDLDADNDVILEEDEKEDDEECSSYTPSPGAIGGSPMKSAIKQEQFEEEK